MATTQELKELKIDDLQLRLQETRRQLFNLRQQWYAGGLGDHNRIRIVRRDIARILTILRERESNAEIESRGEAA